MNNPANYPMVGVKCEHCGGVGYHQVPIVVTKDGKGEHIRTGDRRTVCPTCKGSGKIMLPLAFGEQ